MIHADDVPGLFVGSAGPDVPESFVWLPRTHCVGLFPGREGVNSSGVLVVLGAFFG